MKTPDKIYCENCSDGMYSHIDRLDGEDNIVYIRKDALLEWLKFAVEFYSHPDPDTDTVVDKIRYEGKKLAFKDVINRIESL